MNDSHTPDGLSAAFGPTSVDELLKQFKNGPSIGAARKWPTSAADSHAEKTSVTASRSLQWLGAPLDLTQSHQVSLTPVDYVLNPILAAKRGALITGVGGSSKTTILKTIATAVATGRSIWTFTVPKRGKAILILAEDTLEDAHRSIDSIARQLNLTNMEMQLLVENLIVYPAAGRDCTLVDPTDGTKSDHLSELEAFAMQLGDVRLIGVDSAIAVTRGRENDELAQRELARRMDDLAIKTGAAVILISHAAKGTQLQQEITSHASRGSGAITDAFRLELLAKVMMGKEAKSFRVPEERRQRYVRLQVTKANSLSPDLMRPVWLERVEGGALREAELITPPPGISSRQVKGLELFVELDQESGELTPSDLTFQEWKSRAASVGILTGKTPSAQDMAARRLVAALKDSGEISEASGKLRITEEGLARVHLQDE